MVARIVRTCVGVCLFVLAAGAAIAQTVTLPGTIQAENFDQGGAGVAYVDSTPGNAGGQYRAADVDIELTADSGGGHNIGWTAAGEWLRYPVNVSTAGTYDIEVRVASRAAGGRFHIEVNGVDRTGPLTIPSTGNWQTWTTVRRTGVNLSGGAQTWRLVMDSPGSGTTSVGNFNYIRVTGPIAAGASSTPYTGTPAPLPGTLHVENFDNGPDGVAYHDLSVTNQGGQYRSTGVDIASTSDGGAGYMVGNTAAGEWLNYTVNVGAAGTYDVEVRVASNGNGGTFHIEVNGADRSGPFTIPNTGGWHTWLTIRKTGLTLAAGTQVWRLVMDTNGPRGAVGNFNYIRVVPSSAGTSGSTPFTGTPIVLPGVVQAEDFDNGGEGIGYHDLSAGNSGGQYRSTGVDIERTADTTGSYNLGWVDPGEWLSYTVNVSAAGTYDIEARVASPGGGGRFHIEVNGVDRTGPFIVPATGSWQTWVTVRKTGLSLAAGRQVWRLVMDADGATGLANVNYIRLVSAGTTNPPPTSAITSPVSGATYTAPAALIINANAADANGTVARVDFYAGTQLIGTDTSSPYSAGWSNVAAGSYALTAVAVDNAGASTRSAVVNVTVTTGPTATPTTLVFNPSTDHATGVTSYSVAVYRASGPVTATPAGTRNLGKPAPSNNVISVNISTLVDPLPAGSYYAVVTAIGPGGSAASTPSAAFTK